MPKSVITRIVEEAAAAVTVVVAMEEEEGAIQEEEGAMEEEEGAMEEEEGAMEEEEGAMEATEEEEDVVEIPEVRSNTILLSSAVCCCWSVVLQCLNCFQDFHLPVWFGYCVLFLKDLAEIRGMRGSSFYQLTVTL